VSVPRRTRILSSSPTILAVEGAMSDRVEDGVAERGVIERPVEDVQRVGAGTVSTFPLPPRPKREDPATARRLFR